MSTGTAEPKRRVRPRASRRACVGVTRSSAGTGFAGRLGASSSWSNSRSFAGRRCDDEALVLQADRGSVGDPGRTQGALRQADPAAAADHDRVLAAARNEPLVADPSVTDVDDSIGVLDRGGIVTDEKRRRSLLAHELRDRARARRSPSRHRARRSARRRPGGAGDERAPRTPRSAAAPHRTAPAVWRRAGRRGQRAPSSSSTPVRRASRRELRRGRAGRRPARAAVSSPASARQ